MTFQDTSDGDIDIDNDIPTQTPPEMTLARNTIWDPMLTACASIGRCSASKLAMFPYQIQEAMTIERQAYNSYLQKLKSAAAAPSDESTDGRS